MQQNPPDDIRRSRFAFDPEFDPPTSRQSRAASQPPNSSAYYTVPSIDLGIASRRLESSTLGSSPGSRLRDPSPSGWPPASRAQVSASRSISFSEQPSSSGSRMAQLTRDSRFASTFEDDEESVDEFDAFAPSQSLGNRMGEDLSRGRPQSIGPSTMRPRIASSPLQSQMGYPSNTSLQSSTRYNPGLANSRIDTNITSPSSRLSYDRFGYRTGVDDLSNMSPFVRDLNQIPFSDDGLRDVWGSGLGGREDGGGSGATSRRHSVSVVQPRRGVSVGFNAGGLESGSPKSALSEFPDGGFGSIRNGGVASYGGGRGLMFSDDELAGSLNSLNLNLENEPSRTPRVMGPSQPSSLPNYAPHRGVGSPLDVGNGARGVGLNLVIPGSANTPHNLSTHSYTSSRFDSYSDNEHVQSPSTADRPQQVEPSSNEYKNGNGAGPASFNDRYATQRHTYGGTYTEGDIRRQQSGAAAAYNQLVEMPYDAARHSQPRLNGAPPSPTTVRGGLPPLTFQGLNRNAAYMASMSSPRSPTVPTYAGAANGPQPLNGSYGQYYSGTNQPPIQQSAHAHHHQRQGSLPTDANGSMNELGRGVPLHAVPSSSPLYIVEFKAGRTDIFYTTSGDSSLNNLRTGDLVIVEADRGKDLGRIINDSITPVDVETYQAQQAENAALQQQQMMMSGGEDGAPPTSRPKELMPKRIYAKATPQDTQ